MISFRNRSRQTLFLPQIYNIPSALDPPASLDASFFLNGKSTTHTRATAIEAMYLADPAVKEAIHAPNKDWALGVDYLFGGESDFDPSKWFPSSFTSKAAR